ncbi:hypothetical protein KEM55_004268 [Ascosphaera atra]|nr:hypothetical protein KEM55_004268 [Ascosphaera atra]
MTAQDSQNPLTLPEKQGNPAATASAALPRTPPSSSRLQTPTQFLLPAFPDQSTNPLSDLDYFIYGLEGKAGSEEETGGCGPSSSSSLSRHGLSMSMSFGLDGAADDPEESQQQNKSNFPLASPFAASSSATGRLPSHGPSEEGQQGGRAAGVAVPVPVPAAQATASFHPNNGRHGRPQYNVNKNITATTTTDTRERKVDAEPLITDMGLDMGMATSDCAPNGNANGVATSSQNNGAQHDAATLLQTPPPSSASRRRQQQQQQQQTHEGTNNANGADDGMAQIWTDLDSSSPGWSWSRALQGEDGDGVATPAGMIGMGGGGGMLGADAQQQQQQQLRTPVRTTRWFTHGLEKTPGLGGTGGTGRAFTTPKKEGEPFTSSPVPGAQGKGATSTAANLPSSTPSYAGLLSTPNNAAPTSYDDGYYYPYTDDPLTEMLLQQSGNLFSDFGMGMGMGMGLGGGMGTGTGMGIGPGQVPASSPIPLPAANRGYYGYPQHTHHLQHQQSSPSAAHIS